MAKSNRLLKALSMILPAGAVGASVLLALVSTDTAAMPNQANPARVSSGESVATRLQVIRSGVSDMTGSADGEVDSKAAPAWWGNGGWGRWHAGWGNGGGWHHGGWGNGGWHNWHNWGNGGWPNGWHNFWHNW